MLTTLATAFMTATRMDGFAPAAAGTVLPCRPRPSTRGFAARGFAARGFAARGFAARVLAGLRRLAG